MAAAALGCRGARKVKRCVRREKFLLAFWAPQRKYSGDIESPTILTFSPGIRIIWNELIFHDGGCVRKLNREHVS